MKSAYDVILTPVISEQSMDVAADKKYTFQGAGGLRQSTLELDVLRIIFD